MLAHDTFPFSPQLVPQPQAYKKVTQLRNDCQVSTTNWWVSAISDQDLITNLFFHVDLVHNDMRKARSLESGATLLCLFILPPIGTCVICLCSFFIDHQGLMLYSRGKLVLLSWTASDGARNDYEGGQLLKKTFKGKWQQKFFYQRERVGSEGLERQRGRESWR